MTDTPKTTTTSSSTPSTSDTSKSSTTSSTSAPKSTQYIAPSVDDDKLEPDAMRGSEQYLKDTGVDNLEQQRIEKLQEEQKKPA
jgi:hypothetical protein